MADPAELERFAHALLLGGGISLGRPPRLRDVRELEARFELGVVPDELLERRARVAAKFTSVAVSPRRTEATLLGALYGVLALGHPEVRDSSHRVDRIGEYCLELLDLQPVESVQEAVARHLWLAALRDLARDDVLVSFWAGKRHFRGQPVPTSLRALPRLRRIRATVSRVVWPQLIDELPRPVIAALLKASPLSAMLFAPELATPVEWPEIAVVLTDKSLCRVVVGHYLELGLPRVAPWLVEKIEGLTRAAELSPPSAAAQRLLAGLLAFLVVVEADQLGGSERWKQGGALAVVAAAIAAGVVPPLEQQLTSRPETLQKIRAELARHEQLVNEKRALFEVRFTTRGAMRV